MILRAGIEILFAAWHWRRYSLISLAQLPPRFVVIVWSNFTRKDFPAPLVYEIPKRKKRDFIQRPIQQESDVRRWLRDFIDQPELFQVRRRDGQCDRIAYRFVKRVVCAFAEEKRPRGVGHLVIVMAELVMHGGEIFLVYLHAHFQPHVFFVVEVPRARVTNDFSIGRFHKQRSFPKGCRQRIKTKRREERLAVANHLLRVSVSRF